MLGGWPVTALTDVALFFGPLASGLGWKVDVGKRIKANAIERAPFSSQGGSAVLLRSAVLRKLTFRFASGGF